MIPIFSLSNRRKVGFNEEMKERQTEAVSFQSKVWMQTKDFGFEHGKFECLLDFLSGDEIQAVSQMNDQKRSCYIDDI